MDRQGRLILVIYIFGLFIAINIYDSYRNEEKKSYEPTKTDTSLKNNYYDCKGNAVEIAARVVTNIRAGQSDFFYKIDLSDYQQNSCKKDDIMTAVEALK